jgi:hypothetical protein
VPETPGSSDDDRSVRVFQVKVDRIRAVVEIALGGHVPTSEMEQFLKELRQVLASLQGREIRMKADLRTFRPMAPEVAEILRKAHEFALSVGVTQIAEIVESDLLALQLNRVARESGGDKIVRRFWTEETAMEWLLHPESAPAPTPRSTPGSRG